MAKKVTKIEGLGSEGDSLVEGLNQVIQTAGSVQNAVNALNITTRNLARSAQQAAGDMAQLAEKLRNASGGYSELAARLENMEDANKDLQKTFDVQAYALQNRLKIEEAEAAVARQRLETDLAASGLSQEEQQRALEEFDKLQKNLKTQKLQLEAAARLKEIDQKRELAMENINKKAKLFKEIFTDRRVAFAFLTAGAIKFGETLTKIYDAAKQDGLSVTQALGASFSSIIGSIRATLSSGIYNSAEDVARGRKAVQELGGSLSEASVAGEKAAEMATRFGGTVENASKAIYTLESMPGLTKESADNIAKFNSELAEASNVPADTVTKAIATNVDAAAKAGPLMVKSFGQAAINAQKIGVQFSTMVTMSDKLLDFENSINAQMEASVLLGKEINLDKARDAALHGDYLTVQKEILRQVGSEAEFTKLNVLQKQKLAEAMGVQVGDLAKMVKHQGVLTDGTDLEAQNRGKSAAFLAAIADFGARHAGSVAAIIPSLIQMVFQYRTLAAIQGTQTKGVGGFFKSLFGFGQKPPVTPPMTPGSQFGPHQDPAMYQNQGGAGSTPPANNKVGILDKLQKIDAKQMFATAAAIAAVGAALLLIGVGIYIASKGLAELVASFKDLTGGKIVGALLAVVAVLGAFTFMVSLLAKASIAADAPLLALGAAFLMIGGGIALAAVGIGYMVQQFGKIPYENLTALPLAMTGIGLGLMMMAEAGAMAIPVIGMIVALGAVAPRLASLSTALNSKPGEKKEKVDPVAKAVNDLGVKIDKLAAQPVVVSIDGTAIVKAVRQNTNLTKIGTGISPK